MAHMFHGSLLGNLDVVDHWKRFFVSGKFFVVEYLLWM
jgi:hypothetical protein